MDAIRALMPGSNRSVMGQLLEPGNYFLNRISAAMKRKGESYTYRRHQVTMTETGWTIEGPAYQGQARTREEAQRLIDEAPGAPPKADPSAAGRMGAQAMWSKYELYPVGTSEYALVRREDGKIINTISGQNFRR